MIPKSYRYCHGWLNTRVFKNIGQKWSVPSCLRSSPGFLIIHCLFEVSLPESIYWEQMITWTIEMQGLLLLKLGTGHFLRLFFKAQLLSHPSQHRYKFGIIEKNMSCSLSWYIFQGHTSYNILIWGSQSWVYFFLGRTV